MEDDTLARALGWFSVGIGLAQVLAPRRFGRSIGIGEHPLLVRLIGAREIASGVGILTRPDPAPWVEARAAGDLLDLALLSVAFKSPAGRREPLAAAAAATAGVTALDILYGALLERTRDRDVHVRPTITVDRPCEALYRFWRDPRNLPLFMRHLESVRAVDANRWHWVAKGPLRTKVEWDSQIIDDRPNELIVWRSVQGSDLDIWGAVIFEPAGRGTRVRVDMGYRPPRGALGAKVARMFGKSPEQQAGADLRVFKQMMEAGEAQSLARARSEGLGQVSD